MSDCNCCGWCCKNEGRCRVSLEDVARISQYLNLSESDFLITYCIKERDGIFLKQKNPVLFDGECIFLENDLCVINDQKPERCASWPEWPEVQSDKEHLAWASKSCNMLKRELGNT